MLNQYELNKTLSLLFTEKLILDIKTHYKPTETFQYTHFRLCHPLGVKRGFIKSEAIRLLRTNSSKTTFEEYLANLKARLEACGYPKKYIKRLLSEVTFDSRQSALKKQNRKNCRETIAFCHYIPPCDKET